MTFCSCAFRLLSSVALQVPSCLVFVFQELMQTFLPKYLSIQLNQIQLYPPSFRVLTILMCLTMSPPYVVSPMSLVLAPSLSLRKADGFILDCLFKSCIHLRLTCCFDHQEARLKQLDIRDKEKKHIPPWKLYDALKPGTIILTDISLHCYIYPKKTPQQGRPQDN